MAEILQLCEHIDIGLGTFELVLLVHQEAEGLFLFIFTQCEGVRGCELTLAAVEFLEGGWISFVDSRRGMGLTTNSSSSFLRDSSSLRLSSAWSFLSFSNLAWSWMDGMFQCQLRCKMTSNSPPFHCPWVQLPFPWHGRRTFDGLRLPSLAAPRRGSSFWLRKFAGMKLKRKSLVSQTVTTRSRRLLTWISHRVGVSETHLLQSLHSVQLVVPSVRLFAHVFHVCADQHFTELNEVTVSLVFHLHDALKYDGMIEVRGYSQFQSTHPWILPRSDHFAAQLDKLGAANHCERNVRVHLRVDFEDRLVVGRELVDLNSVCFEFLVDFCLKAGKSWVSRPWR